MSNQTTSKALPKLTAAQKMAWACILRTRHADGHFNQSIAEKRTLKALVNKGMLIAEVNSIGWTEYTIAPDYLPTPAPEADASDQDAAPVEEETPGEFNGVPLYVFEEFESIRQSGEMNMFDRRSFTRLASGKVATWVLEGHNYRKILSEYGAWKDWRDAQQTPAELAPVASEPGEPEAVNVFERGDMVRTKPVSAGIPFEVSSTYTSPVTGKTYVRGRVNGEPTSYFVDELELAPSEPEAVDEGRVNEFKDTMADSPSNAVNRYSGLLQEFRDLENENTELKLEVQRKANENASLQGQLEALRVYAAELDRKLKRSQTALETSHTAGYASGYNEGRTELEAENARLRVFLTAIKDEAETDLGEWLGVAFDQVFPSKQAMKAIYEGARDALDPPADNS